MRVQASRSASCGSSLAGMVMLGQRYDSRREAESSPVDEVFSGHVDAATEGATDAGLGLARGADDALFTALWSVAPGVARPLLPHARLSARRRRRAAGGAAAGVARGSHASRAAVRCAPGLYTGATRTCLDVIEHRGYLGIARTPSHCVTGGDRDCSSPICRSARAPAGASQCTPGTQGCGGLDLQPGVRNDLTDPSGSAKLLPAIGTTPAVNDSPRRAEPGAP